MGWVVGGGGGGGVLCSSSLTRDGNIVSSSILNAFPLIALLGSKSRRNKVNHITSSAAALSSLVMPFDRQYNTLEHSPGVKNLATSERISSCNLANRLGDVGVRGKE